jgi:hypothetical protein
VTVMNITTLYILFKILRTVYKINDVCFVALEDFSALTVNSPLSPLAF